MNDSSRPTDRISDLDSVSGIVDELRRLTSLIEAVVASPELPGIIAPDRLYSPDEVAHYIGLKSTRAAKTVLAIPDLPRTNVGPNGGIPRYKGSDLLTWMERRKAA